MSKKKDNKNFDASSLSDDKIVSEILAKKKELMSLRFKLKLGELTDTSQFKKIKNDVARLNTELHKRKKVEG